MIAFHRYMHNVYRWDNIVEGSKTKSVVEVFCLAFSVVTNCVWFHNYRSSVNAIDIAISLHVHRNIIFFCYDLFRSWFWHIVSFVSLFSTIYFYNSVWFPKDLSDRTSGSCGNHLWCKSMNIGICFHTYNNVSLYL